ncbi:MAG: CDP-alcohol phosphatidyltransferase family protein [Acidobacteriota bacterium]|nr:CDP-alcohol phosphatidyltransferase family protein [Acidobacteriota bacterium]
MISHKIGESAEILLRGIVKALVFLRITPNHLTFLGFLMSIVTAYTFSQGHFSAAGIILIIAGLFDMVDGIVARMTNNETRFGAFFDSIMDRYSDLIMYLGLIIWYGREDRMTYVVLVGIVMMGSVLTSYARARAESLIPKCKVGFLERPERIVLLIIGSFYSMDPVIWVIAVLSNWTVIHRILYTRACMTGKSTWVISNRQSEKEQEVYSPEPAIQHPDSKTE